MFNYLSVRRVNKLLEFGNGSLSCKLRDVSVPFCHCHLVMKFAEHVGAQPCPQKQGLSDGTGNVFLWMNFITHHAAVDSLFLQVLSSQTVRFKEYSIGFALLHFMVKTSENQRLFLRFPERPPVFYRSRSKPVVKTLGGWASFTCKPP